MNILFITHQLSRTGAPIVLMDVIQFYKACGCRVEVISMEDGPLREELEKDGIIISIMERFWPVKDVFAQAAADYDLVWANTLITYEAVLSLMGTDIPVVWWLHEGEQYFEYFKTVLPDFSRRDLMRNIHVYAVGHYVQDVVRKRYGTELPILHFAINENENVNSENTDSSTEYIQNVSAEGMYAEIKHSKEQYTDKDRQAPINEVSAPGRLRFLIAGTYSHVKAQDVL